MFRFGRGHTTGSRQGARNNVVRSAGTIRKLRLLPLVAATYFMVSGGPYGIEDILGGAGYGGALLLLALVPLVWSLPTSLMVGELASAIPEEGGYVRWVERAMGRFWGFQEAWLSMAASVFDMAIYPVVFVLYLSRLEPTWTAGARGTLCALAVVLVSCAWNLRGAAVVGEGSGALFVILLAPFVVMVALGFWHGFAHGATAAWSTLHLAAGNSGHDWPAAIMVALWNYMGWDNASTVAQEVESPQRNYPRAMLLAAALVALTYVIPMAAVAVAGLSSDRFATGAWADAAGLLGGHWLAVCVVLGGMLSGLGMFNALMMSYARVPFALANQGLLPSVLRRTTRRGVPWVSILVCGTLWAMALRFSFERLISIDLVLYGAALLLEFLALVILRVREPALVRPFRVPGGIPGAILAGLGPATLIAFTLWAARAERVTGMPALLFAVLVAAAGPVVYALAQWRSASESPESPGQHPHPQ